AEKEAKIMTSQLPNQQSAQRTNDGSGTVHGAFKPKGAAVRLRSDGGSEQCFSHGRAQSAAEPASRARQEHMPRIVSERERCCCERGADVASNSNWFSAGQLVGIQA